MTPHRPRATIDLAEFDRHKYGPEILVDVAWIHDIPTYIVDRPHVLRFHELVLITRGSGRAWLDGVRHRVRPRTVVGTGPGQVREWGVEGLDGIVLLFSALFLDQFFVDATFLRRLSCFHASRPGAGFALGAAAAATLRARLLAMRAEIAAWRDDSHHMLRASLYQILVDLARAQRPAVRPRPAPQVHPLVERFQALVDRDFASRHLVHDYTPELAVSPGHLNALCKKSLGVSAKAVIQDRLTLQARRLLLYSREPSARVAHQLGFKNASYFSRHFGRATGQSPTAFRAAHQV